MTEPRNERTSVWYFCTAGNGMEPFVVEEVKRKLSAKNVSHLQGKVIFNSSSHINNIISLKAAERLFLLLKHDTPIKLPTNISQAKAASLLHTKLMANRDDWTSVAILWRRLQRELKDRITDSVLSINTGLKREGNEECSRSAISKQKCDGESTNSTKQEDERRHGRISVELDGVTESKRKRLDPENPIVDQQLSLQSVDQISFRISCKCSGSLARYFTTQGVSKVLGAGLTTLLGWRVDLKNPYLEVNVYLTDDHCLLGIPLTKLPLANRAYIKTTGLRSTVAWALASLAQIQTASCVIDPMCGVGTILMEAAQEHKDANFLGIDIDDGQLVRANRNLVYANLEDRVQVLKASSLVLPLHSACVDAVVCDMPFGRKFGTKTDITINLPHILSEMERVLRVGGILVLLLSPQLSCLIKKLIPQEDIKSNSVQEKKLQTEKQDCPSVAASFTKQLFGQGHNNGTTSSQQTEYLSGHNRTLSSLRLEKTHRVSLGALDGLIHKYVKIDNQCKE